MYGILGENLPHTLSPFLHREIWNCQYRKLEMNREKATQFLLSKQFDGINVTIPYKKLAFEMCDELSDTAKRVGCVNTVVSRGGKLFGYNTDYSGFYKLSRSIGVDFYRKKVIILGTGATSLTVKAVCEDNGAREIIRVSRSGENNYSNIALHKDADVLINTTPIGMYPENDGCTVDLSVFEKLTAVIDVVYNPLKTRLILQAEEMKIPCTGGLKMLVSQAVSSAEIFTGKPIPREKSEAVEKKLTQKTQNIVLVGMPGCGKTTLGKIIAKATGRPFFDTDKEIVAREKMRIEDIFKLHGEEYFRKLESAVISEIGKKTGVIIACGGGSILKEENRLNLRQNGRVYFINRKLDKLSTKGRPLSNGDGALEKLYAQRAKIYRAVCDCEIFSNQETDACAGEIIRDFFS